MQLIVAVDPNCAGVELVANIEGAADVSGEDSSGETVDGVVGYLDDISVVLKLGDNNNRSENLLLDDLGIWVDICEDGRLDWKKSRDESACCKSAGTGETRDILK